MPDVDNEQNTLDSRHVIARMEELKEQREDDNLSEDEADELDCLIDFDSDGRDYADDWEHGVVLVRESYFTQFAQEFAEDLGRTDDAAEWPHNCIDWAAAAEELKHDYTGVEFDGVWYWVR